MPSYQTFATRRAYSTSDEKPMTNIRLPSMTGLMIAVWMVVIAPPYVVALPLPNAIKPEAEPPWAPEPKGRGTVGTVLPCLITLGLCVWTAIHLNVNSMPTTARLFTFKLVWVLAGVLAPEIVLWCSFQQWSEARKIRTAVLRVQTTQTEQPPSPALQPSYRRFWHRTPKSQKRKDHFGMDSAFFVVMGGYAIRPQGEFPGHPVTLTPSGFMMLYERNLIKKHNLDNKAIKDKTKANAIAKALVCVQALWMLVQGIARRANALPVTLLEGHTIAHVACAVFMYAFWWNKPLDAQYPIILDLDPELTAEIYYTHGHRRDLLVETTDPWGKVQDGTPESTSTNRNERDVILPEGSDNQALEVFRGLKLMNRPGECKGGKPGSDSPEPSHMSLLQRQDLVDTENGWQHSRKNKPGPPKADRPGPNCVHLPPGQCLVDTTNGLYISKRRSYINSRWQYFWKNEFMLNTSSVHQRWRSGYHYWSPSPHISNTEVQLIQWAVKRGKLEKDTRKLTITHLLPQKLDNSEANVFPAPHLTTRASNFRIRGSLVDSDTNARYGISAAVLLSLLYGLAHAIAWNGHFPTPIERMFWRISATVVGAYLPAMIPLFAVIAAMSSIKGRLQPKFMKSRLIRRLVEMELFEAVGGVAAIFILLPLVATYLLARIFLVVESFLSVRSLPKGSFETIPWTKYWPHF